MYILDWAKMKEKRRSFLRGEEGLYRVRLPQIARSFYETKNVSPFVKLE